jgi:hypothetical protein
MRQIWKKNSVGLEQTSEMRLEKEAGNRSYRAL